MTSAARVGGVVIVGWIETEELTDAVTDGECALASGVVVR